MPGTFHRLSLISKTYALGQSLNPPPTAQEPALGAVNKAAYGAETPNLTALSSLKHTQTSRSFFLSQEVEGEKETGSRSRQSNEIWADI